MLTDGWLTGAKYATQDGTVMRIVVELGPFDKHFISADTDGDDDSHRFDMRGNSKCPNCTHGHLQSRVSGMERL